MIIIVLQGNGLKYIYMYVCFMHREKQNTFLHNKTTEETRMKFLNSIQDSNVKNVLSFKSALKNRNILKS